MLKWKVEKKISLKSRPLVDLTQELEQTVIETAQKCELSWQTNLKRCFLAVLQMLPRPLWRVLHIAQARGRNKIKESKRLVKLKVAVEDLRNEIAELTTSVDEEQTIVCAFVTFDKYALAQSTGCTGLLLKASTAI